MFGLVFRLISAAIVLSLTAFFTPGFSIDGVKALIVAVIVLSLIDFILSKIFDIQAKPFGRGISGFAVTVIVLYVTKFLVEGFDINLLSAIIAAFVYGIISAIVPGKGVFEGSKKD